MKRQKWSLTRTTAILLVLFVAISFSGCMDDGDNDDGPVSKLEEVGSYAIKSANELFGQDPESEEKVNEYLDNVMEETSGVPLFEVTSLEYFEESGITSSGIINPTPAPAIKDQYEHALNAGKLGMDLIIEYLNNDNTEEEEKSIKGFIDDESFGIIQDLKAKGITIDNYAVTRGNHDNNGVMYLKNTFATKEKRSYDMSLNGHILMKLENKGDKDDPNWMPTEILDYEVHIPAGIPSSENGFYYLGSASQGNGEIFHHAWIEKNADIPMISEILPKLGKGKEPLHVSDYEDAIKQYDLLTSANRDGREERVHHHEGGRIVMTGKGKIYDVIDGKDVNHRSEIVPMEVVVPAGDYTYVLYNDGKDKKLGGIGVHDEKQWHKFYIGESDRRDMSNSLIWKVAISGQVRTIKFCDGFEENGCDEKPPADGIIDYMIALNKGDWIEKTA